MARRRSLARGGPRRWRRPLLLALLALVGWVLFAPPRIPGGSRLGAFDPEQIATLEQQSWEAYYYRQWPRLFWHMLQVMRSQFGLSWAQALYAAYLATRAQLVFARAGDASGEAQALMQGFYALVKEPAGGAYDPAQAAAAELRWWIVHRHRHDYPDYSQLELAMADLYATTYGLPVEAVQAAARHRVAAVALSDRWLDDDKPADSPLLRQIRDELAVSYRALKAALDSRRER